VLDTVPAALMRWISGGLLKQLDVIASNVPGIPVPVYCGEAELLRFYRLVCRWRGGQRDAVLPRRLVLHSGQPPPAHLPRPASVDDCSGGVDRHVIP
jgi:hypothetical protein